MPAVRTTALVLAGWLAAGCAAGADLGDLLGRAGPGAAPLSEARIAEGLREALRVGTGNAVALVGRPDGYLEGPDTAATDYFRARTQPDLAAAFRPIVGRALGEVGVTAQYRALVARYNQIPLATPQATDLDGYVTGRALAGLFTTLADEERKIRTDPAARVTALLREVFGRRQ